MPDKNLTEKTEIAVMSNDIGYIKSTIVQMDKKFDNLANQFVTRNEFNPVRNIVYGAVSLILTAALIALLTLIFKGGIYIK